MSQHYRENRIETRFDCWILGVVGVSAWCCLAGWMLSILGILNATGYLVSAGITLGVWLFLRRRTFFLINKPQTRRLRWIRRRHPLLWIFLLCACLTGIGGFIHAPNNYDALTYRIPRVLHWLAEGRWHWIETMNDRMNYSGTGQEWLAAPFLAILHSDRLFFLTNWIPFLLLPGLIFATFTRLGIAGRVARAWMWLIPTSLNFVLQAASIGNDTLGGFYLLAALYLAMRSVENGRISFLFWSVAAISLMTALKASNLPLALPWVLVLWPVWQRFEKKIFRIVPAAVFLAVLTSALPTLWFNHHYKGDWTGDPNNSGLMKLNNPIAGLIGNTLQSATGFLQPPVFPIASRWNDWSDHLIPASTADVLKRDFPRFGMHLPELPQEEGAGIGLAVTLCLGSLFFVWKKGVSAVVWDWRLFVCVSIVPCLLVYFAKFGSECTSRLLSAYYPLVFALALRWPGAVRAIQTKWWRTMALLAAVSAILPILLTPSRPLWPAQFVLKVLADQSVNSTIQRAQRVYQTYANRNHSLNSLLHTIAPNEDQIGLIAQDDAQTGLWQPYGSRRLVDITPDNAALIMKGLPVVASKDALRYLFGLSPEEFCAAYNLGVSDRQKLIIKAGQPAMEWFVFKSR